MKNLTIKLSAIIAIGIFSFISCKKDTQTFNPSIEPGTPSASASALTNLFSTHLTDLKQSFVLDSDSPVTIYGSKGTAITFPASAFVTLSGGAVTGNVDIELIEIFDKGDMMLANIPTMGYSKTKTLSPLVSGGEFFISASQGGQELKLKPYGSYYVNVPAPSGTDPRMDIFYGDETTQPDTVIWQNADSSFIQGTGTAGYNCAFDSLRWTNLDYFYNSSNPMTNVTVNLPTGFTNKTCGVFISFDNENVVAGLSNYSNGTFTTDSPYKLPTGLGVKVVAIAIINDIPQLSITPATISNNIVINLNALTATTKAQMKTDINNLP